MRAIVVHICNIKLAQNIRNAHPQVDNREADNFYNFYGCQLTFVPCYFYSYSAKPQVNQVKALNT